MLGIYYIMMCYKYFLSFFCLSFNFVKVIFLVILIFFIILQINPICSFMASKFGGVFFGVFLNADKVIKSLKDKKKSLESLINVIKW